MWECGIMESLRPLVTRHRRAAARHSSLAAGRYRAEIWKPPGDENTVTGSKIR